MAGFFERLKRGLTKSRSNILENMDELFGESAPINDDFYEELEEILVMADVGFPTASAIIEEMQERVEAEKILDRARCKTVLIELIKAKLQMPQDAYFFINRKSVILVIGVNGDGKTTSVGKL